MITLLETQVKIGMSIYEARALMKSLGAVSPAQLHDAGLTLGEIQTQGEIYAAIKAFLNGSQTSEDK
jgi:tRNA threonylcarbamoyladenosine modification (KEOPS) complex Cgi121 subunit